MAQYILGLLRWTKTNPVWLKNGGNHFPPFFLSHKKVNDEFSKRCFLFTLCFGIRVLKKRNTMEIVRSQSKFAGAAVVPTIPLYRSAPHLEVRLEDFELFAIDRLRGIISSSIHAYLWIFLFSSYEILRSKIYNVTLAEFILTLGFRVHKKFNCTLEWFFGIIGRDLLVSTVIHCSLEMAKSYLNLVRLFFILEVSVSYINHWLCIVGLHC